MSYLNTLPFCSQAVAQTTWRVAGQHLSKSFIIRNTSPCRVQRLGQHHSTYTKPKRNNASCGKAPASPCDLGPATSSASLLQDHSTYTNQKQCKLRQPHLQVLLAPNQRAQRHQMHHVCYGKRAVGDIHRAQSCIACSAAFQTEVEFHLLGCILLLVDQLTTSRCLARLIRQTLNPKP